MEKKKLLSEKILNRAKAYTAVAGAIVSGTEVSAAIVYTDVSPDFSGGIGSQYFLDLNNDNVNDFRIYHNSSYNLFIEPLNSNNEVLGSGGFTYAYPYALSANSPVSASASGGWFNNGFSSGYQSLNYGSSASYGNWVSVTDKYLGLRFQVGSNTYYAWCRLDVNADGSSWTVKDYAYEDVAGTGINAGANNSPSAVTADTAFAVMPADIGNNNNGTDVEITFSAAAQENTVDEYRLILVKNDSIANFTMADALALSSSSFTAVTPSGASSYTQALGAAQTDAHGNLIASNVAYRAVILNMPDGVNANTAALSTASAAFTLDFPADVALSIIANDVGDANDASDIEVTFGAAAMENTVGEYRIMLVKAASAGGFDVASASAMLSSSYEVVTPNGASTYSKSLSALLTDIDGDPITSYVDYVAFVLSTPTGSATMDSLSAPSTVFNLELAADLATGVTGADIAENDNGLDLEFTFNGASNEAGIAEYRVVAVKSTAAGMFDLSAAQALTGAAYELVSPNGSSSYTQSFNPASTDSDGDLIVSNETYQLFVLSVANGTQASFDNLSVPSADITLTLNASVAASIQATDISDIGNGEDLEVSFNAATNEATVSEYRVMVVKAAQASSFDLSAAQSVADYLSVSPTASATYTNTFSSTSSDVDGDLLVEDEPYHVFVMSIAGGNATVDALSSMSNEITLTDASGISTSSVLENIQVYAFEKRLVVDASELQGTGVLALYDLSGRLQTSVQLTSGVNQINLDQSGVYLARVSWNNNIKTTKVYVR